MLRSFLCCMVCAMVLAGCSFEGNKTNIDLSGIPVPEVKIHRYEKALFSLNVNHLQTELESLSDEYGFFLGEDYNDSMNIMRLHNYLTDTIILEVAADCAERLPDLSSVEKDLSDAFRHYLYYFPGAELPEIFTYISGFDLENRIALVDGVLLIAIDTYLGSDYEKYEMLGIPAYRYRNMEISYLADDCLREIGKQYTDADSSGYKLLGQMVYEGKLLWFTKLMNPGTPDTILMKYTAAQLEWAKESEYSVWAFIIENDMLYSSDLMMTRKFISDGPFTSYFLNDSPPRLGSWIGWKMLEGYRDKNPEKDVRSILQEYDAQKILSSSGYKPPRPS